MKKELLLWLLVVFLGALVYDAARADSPPVNRCILALVENVNPSLMSRQTARRKARAICYDMRYSDRDFYKAITQ